MTDKDLEINNYKEKIESLEKTLRSVQDQYESMKKDYLEISNQSNNQNGHKQIIQNELQSQSSSISQENIEELKKVIYLGNYLISNFLSM